MKLGQEFLKHALVISTVRIKAPLDDSIREHVVFGWFRSKLEGKDGDVGVDGNILKPILMVRPHVGPSVELIEERSFHTGCRENLDTSG